MQYAMGLISPLFIADVDDLFYLTNLAILSADIKKGRKLLSKPSQTNVRKRTVK